jgi:hypothetical protein
LNKIETDAIKTNHQKPNYAKTKQKINNAIYTANFMKFSAHINLNSSVISTLNDVMNMCEFEMMAKAVKC